MSVHLSTRTRVAVALHHARREITLPDRDVSGRQHHRDLMCDMIEGADYPHTVLAEVARRLGRQRSLQVELPRDLVDAAIRQPKVFEGRL